ncbi:MAG TPA: TRAP transporter substrate-binding protein [Xanthobacteraceae bacterium]|jgi:TRAP-type mannitol/chloroaromatic compound transport system substrate-binding protein
MRRRDILASVGSLSAGLTLSFPAPAIAQGIRQLRMVTDWPRDLPGQYPSAVRFAETVAVATGGRIKIEVFPSGALVRPFETFDAVSAGVADMYHTDEAYFEKKSPAFNFFAVVPFGFTADELFAWVQYGGGQELWDALNGQFNIKSLLCTSTGCQMGGWFNHEVNAPEDYKGLRYRMAGPGAEVLRRLGAIVLLLPASEIMPALKSGALDACEWVGPWLDMAMGLHKAVGFYYYPGFHEPGTGLAVGINKGVWESFDATDRQVIEAVAASEYARSLAEFNANNALSLRELRNERTVKILKFDDSLLRAFLAMSRDVVAEIGSGDELSKKIYASYQRFRASIMDWSNISERAYFNARGLG